jgi:aldehyde:ferredoxin oxidoreductase
MLNIARINLSNAEITHEKTPPELIQRWLGGRGLGAALLYDLVGPEVEPFDAENCLIFTTGLLNGTSWASSARYHVTFKSPATGAYGYANAGGYFAREMRLAGYDAIIVTGKAASPAMIRIVDDEIKIQSAEHLWGKLVSEVDAQVLPEGGRVVSIGPGGENLVRIAAILSDNGRAAARSGPGAVMGSKNLKAIHIQASSRKSDTPSNFAPVAKKTSKYLINHPRAQKLMNESTLFLMQAKQNVGDLPAKNHQQSTIPFIRDIDSEAFSGYWAKRKGCSACPIRCSRYTELGEGDEKIAFEGPEYETANAFGPMVWNADPEVVIKANYLCNEYGLDTISAGVCIAFAMECHQRGLLDDETFSLEWGDEETILGLIEQIGKRQGLGDILADGVRIAAEKIGQGAEALAMHVKGVELPRQEPRKIKGMALTHAVSNRGADHLYSLSTIDTNGLWDVAKELFPDKNTDELMDTTNETYKPDIVIYGEHFAAIVDALGVCKFSANQNYVVSPDQLAEGLQALGVEMTKEDLFITAERIVNVERLYNVRSGLDRSADQLPTRFTKEPLDIYSYSENEETGEVERSEKPLIAGALVDLDKMLDKYYRMRGWNENGVPTDETIERVGLSSGI